MIVAGLVRGDGIDSRRCAKYSGRVIQSHVGLDTGHSLQRKEGVLGRGFIPVPYLVGRVAHIQDRGSIVEHAELTILIVVMDHTIWTYY